MAAWPSAKKHTGELGRDAKLDVRKRVLSEIAEASVLDVFCGPLGEMHEQVWSRAKHYVGIDTDWCWTDKRRRFVAEAQLVLRAIDLQPFNVFDLDAYGSPWTEAIVLAARRRWAHGERGALVVTDGGDKREKFGAVGALSELVGEAHHKSVREARQRAALGAWCRRAGVVPERIWAARGYSNRRGTQMMFYAAVVFRGATRAEASAAPA